MPRKSVLKNIEPHGSALDNMLKLAYGRTANDPVYEMVRQWRFLKKWGNKLAERRKTLLVRLAGRRPIVPTLPPPQTPDDEEEYRILCQKDDKWIADSERKLAELEARFKPLLDRLPIEADETGRLHRVEETLTSSDDREAFAYCRDARHHAKMLAEARRKLLVQAEATICSAPDWWKKMAEAVECEVEAERKGKDAYPLHAAVMKLARLRPAKSINGGPVFEVGGPVIRELPYTLSQVCKQLEPAGLRPSGMSDESWQRRVRKVVCEDLGFKLATPTPQTESDRQRFTPAMLGLPANFGKPSFWTRRDLQHQLYEARTKYRQLLRRVHPDKGGDAETFCEVKRLWRNVQNRFKRQGYKLTR